MQSLTFTRILHLLCLRKSQCSAKKILSPLNTHKSHIIHVVHDLLSVCSNIQHLNYSRQELKNLKRIICKLTTVTLKQSQSHQTYDENVDPNQAYNHAKFEISSIYSV